MDEPRDRAYFTSDEVEQPRELTDTELDEGDVASAEGGAASFAGLASNELRSGETDDPNVAAQEGMTYVPPTGPSLIADPESPDGVEMAAGFADADDHRPEELLYVEEEFEALIRDALRANGATSRYADGLLLGNLGGAVVVRGMVDDLDDDDAIVDVISRVPGVTSVRDEIGVSGVTD